MDHFQQALERMNDKLLDSPQGFGMNVFVVGDPELVIRAIPKPLATDDSLYSSQQKKPGIRVSREIQLEMKAADVPILWSKAIIRLASGSSLYQIIQVSKPHHGLCLISLAPHKKSSESLSSWLKQE